MSNYLWFLFLLILTHVVKNGSTLESNYKRNVESSLYVFYDEDDESSNNNRQGIKEKVNLHSQMQELEKRNTLMENEKIFTSHLKSKYKSKKNETVTPLSHHSLTNSQNETYICDKTTNDSKCNNTLYRLCYDNEFKEIDNYEEHYNKSVEDYTNGNNNQSLCVDIHIMIMLLESNRHFLAGRVHQGYYYDCMCNKKVVKNNNDSEHEVVNSDNLHSSPSIIISSELDFDEIEHVVNDTIYQKDNEGDWFESLFKCDIMKLINTENNTVYYKASISIVLDDNNIQPQSIIIGLNPYNLNINQRGTCDSKKTNHSALWDSNSLWNPYSSINRPMWKVKRKFIRKMNTQIVTYEANFNKNDLHQCLGPNGENNLVTEFESYLQGSWFITKVHPKDLYNSLVGEIVSYQAKCSFKLFDTFISQPPLLLKNANHKPTNRGLDTLSFSYLDDKKNDIYIKNLLPLCTEEGFIAFSVTTCIKEKGKGSTYLFDPIMKQNSLFSISPSNRSACLFKSVKFQRDDNDNGDICCQDWIIQGITNDTKPPLVGNIELKWKYSDNFFVVIIRNTVPSACDSYNDVVLDDVLEGHIKLYRDPQFSTPYECCNTKPIIDSHRIYIALILSINPLLCNEFLGIIINVTLVYYKDRSDGGGIIDTILIYNINQPIINRIYDVIIESKAKETCMPKLSWLAIKRVKEKTAKMKIFVAWNATHVPYENSYPVLNSNEENSKTFETTRFANSMNIPLKNENIKHYGTHSEKTFENSHIVKIYNKQYTNKFAIYKDQAKSLSSYMTNSDVRNNGYKMVALTTREKAMSSTSQSQKLPFVRFKFSNKVEYQNVEASCPEFSEWNDIDQQCSQIDFYYWFPGARGHKNQSEWLIAVFLFIVFLFAIPFFLFFILKVVGYHRHRRNMLKEKVSNQSDSHGHHLKARRSDRKQIKKNSFKTRQSPSQMTKTTKTTISNTKNEDNKKSNGLSTKNTTLNYLD